MSAATTSATVSTAATSNIVTTTNTLTTVTVQFSDTHCHHDPRNHNHSWTQHKQRTRLDNVSVVLLAHHSVVVWDDRERHDDLRTLGNATPLKRHELAQWHDD
jgi:hypothetical protein